MMRDNNQSVEHIETLLRRVGVSDRVIAEVRDSVLKELQNAYRRGADSIRNSPDYHYKEDMGR